MELEPRIWFPIIISFFFFCVTILPKSHSEQQPNGYSDCYHPFKCGNSGDLYYPFWSAKLLRPSYCGGEGFELDCPENESEYPSIKLGSQTFNITWIEPDPYNTYLYNMRMVRTDVAYDNCSSHLSNTSLSTGISTQIILSYYLVKNVILLYDCPENISGEKGLYNFTCQQPQYPPPSKNHVYYFVNDTQKGDGLSYQSLQLQHCRDRIQVPISSDTPPASAEWDDVAELYDYLNRGFSVTVNDSRCTNCRGNGGICGSLTHNASQFFCYYRRHDSHPSMRFFPLH